MKFSNTLEASMLPDWRQYYIDYKALKKVLKQVHTAGPALSAAYQLRLGTAMQYGVSGYEQCSGPNVRFLT